jgi:hypothetical protein
MSTDIETTMRLPGAHRFNLWFTTTSVRHVRRNIALLLMCFLPITTSYALDMARLFSGSGGDSGSGKVAQFALRLRDGFAPTSIVWSPDGKYIATSGTHTRLIHIWDVEQRKLVKELELPNRPAARFHSMAWSPDGRHLATCNSGSSSLRIFTTADWKVLQDFGAERAASCQKPLFSGDGAELTMWGDQLVTFETTGWRETRRLTGEIFDRQFATKPSFRLGWSSLIRDIAYRPGTHELILAGGRYEHAAVDACGPEKVAGTARLWALPPTTQSIQTVAIFCSLADATHLAVHPGGQQVAASTYGVNSTGPLLIAGLAAENLTHGRLREIPAEGSTDALVYTPDGKLLLIARAHAGVRPARLSLIDTNSWQVLDVLGAPPLIHDLTVHPQGEAFAAGAGDGVSVWKLVAH